MKREDVEKAAVNYDSRLVAFRAFMKGAEWRINSVWHDATEKPRLGELIIVEVYGKIWEYGKSDVCDINHPAASWAYIEDLIPNTEE